MGLDQRILLWINHWPDGFLFLRAFSVALNYASVKFVFALLIIGMLVRSAKSRVAVLLALLAVGLANPITDFFKHNFPYHRPFQPMELGSQVILRVGYANSMGTVSAHSANMAAVATVMTLTLGRWGWIWIAIAFFTGLSRIYVGAHYPWQVMGGWLTGTLTGFAVVLTYRFVTSKMDKRHPAAEDVKTPTNSEIAS